MAESDRETKQNTGSAKAEVSLAEELQSIVSELSGAGSDAEAEKGLERLKRLREELGSSSAASAARGKAEELLTRTEERVEMLRRYLARKRRLQEGELMEKVSEKRQAESEVIITIAESAAVAAAAPFPAQEEEKKAPKKAHEKARPKKEPPAPEKQEPAKETPREETPGDETPAPEKEETKRPEHAWSRTYRLTAHMAASVMEDGKYFEKLRRSAVAAGPKLPAPKDHAAAEAYYRSVHGLNVRLINIELKVEERAGLRAVQDRLKRHKKLHARL